MADLVYPPVLLVGYGAFAALGLKVRVHGGEHLPRTGGAVLASSHVSYLDFIFAGYAARPSDRLVRFMAKDSVFRHRVGRADHAQHEAHPGRPAARVLPATPTPWSPCSPARWSGCSPRPR